MLTFRLFGEKRLADVLLAIDDCVKKAVQQEDPEYLLNVNEEEFVRHLKERYSLEPLTFYFDRVEASSEERDVEAQETYFRQFGGVYRKQVITYHLPFSGESDLLGFQPNPSLVWTLPIYVKGSEVCFEIVDHTVDPEEINRIASGYLSNITTQSEHQTKQINDFNASLESKIRQTVAARKKELMAQRSIVDQLGVPIRKSKNVPATFAVPTVRKKVFPKPEASSTVTSFTPTLDPSIYNEILQTIFDMGKTFERLPSTYADKDEPTLRDHLILQLEPRFEGSTTGETFNKAGKTDILIRYEKANIFVAECKFWGGRVQHLETINQLLSYLTWRDSKTAIVYFVDRKEIAPVLQEIASATPDHPCYVRSLGQKEQGSWQIFELHLPTDKDCKITLTILAFHLPKPK